MGFFKQITQGDAIEGKVVYLLALVVLTQTIYPITENSVMGLIFHQFLYLLMIFSGLLLTRDSRRTFSILVFLGIVWIVAALYYALNIESIFAQLLAYASFGAYQAVVAFVLLKFIFAAKKVSRDILYAAVAVYFLLGAIFVPVYGVIEILHFSQTGMNAFSDGLIAAGQPIPWQSFVYYSYVSLTTMGYGDILPQTLWARSAATLESMIGVLYTTIIISRLVALYITHNDGD